MSFYDDLNKDVVDVDSVVDIYDNAELLIVQLKGERFTFVCDNCDTQNMMAAKLRHFVVGCYLGAEKRQGGRVRRRRGVHLPYISCFSR